MPRTYEELMAMKAKVQAELAKLARHLSERAQLLHLWEQGLL